MSLAATLSDLIGYLQFTLVQDDDGDDVLICGAEGLLQVLGLGHGALGHVRVNGARLQHLVWVLLRLVPPRQHRVL
eukprot:5986507-Ditylum_brightwellii.AAC.1